MSNIFSIEEETLNSTADAIRTFSGRKAFNPEVIKEEGKLVENSVITYYREYIDFQGASYVGDNIHKENDQFIGYGFADNSLGKTVPVLYKTDIDSFPEEIDYYDMFYYQGVSEIDGVKYDKWRKIETDEAGISWDSEVLIYYYTNLIVINEGDKISPTEFPNKIKEVYEQGVVSGYGIGYDDAYDQSALDLEGAYQQGKQDWYDQFWDLFQNYGKTKQYSNAFNYGVWPTELYNPKYTFVTESCNGMFLGNTNLTDTKVPLNISKGGQTFQIFNGCTKLVTINKIIVTEKSGGLNQSFTNCKALENLTIEGIYAKDIVMSDCVKLSKASITNIINCLSETISGKSVTLSQTAVDNAFETSEGAADGSASSEWETLKNTKTNWTISLV